jgi:hypothetical protein
VPFRLAFELAVGALAAAAGVVVTAAAAVPGPVDGHLS